MRGGPEVADVFRRYGGIYRDVHAGHLSLDQRKVMGAIEACRSPALGGHVEQCGTRGSRTIPALWADSVMGSWRAGIGIFR
jgi:hypothetical protein